MTKVKVLLLASISPMIESFNQENISLLQNKGCEVHVLANFQDPNNEMLQKNMEFKKKLERNNIKVFDVPIQRKPFSFGNISVYQKIKSILHQEDYTFIHCHSPIGGVLGRLAARYTHNRKTKVIYTAHGFHFFKGAPVKNWLIFYTVEKLLSSYTDYLITINPEDYHNAINRHFKMNEIELVNGVGINLEKFKPTSNYYRRYLRELYGYSEEDILLIYVAELSKNKNQTQAINMMKTLIEKFPQTKLLLVGDGDDHTRYSNMIHQMGLTKQVHLLGYRKDIVNLMSLSDIAISTSRREGLPVNVMEAMAIGLPLVVTNCRGNRDLVQNGVNGYIVEIDNYETLEDKIIRLIQNDRLRTKFGKRSTRFISPYKIQNVNNQMSDIYEKYMVENFSSQQIIDSKIN
ncbi:glycosyltransferase family 4 protein [Lacticigenium naphthae]|uniref:glycosyltransferase family 4 protein n=1 Tax=Lacticigenium naphthae TaxID=515351 RepID=UPI0004045C29|nr:glycosyltransferase family 4 protein [Lacticigenium naphthae]